MKKTFNFYNYLANGADWQIVDWPTARERAQEFWFTQQTDPEALRKELCSAGLVVIRAGKTTSYKLQYDLNRFVLNNWFAPRWLWKPQC